MRAVPDQTFREWRDGWLGENIGGYTGKDVPEVAKRTARLHALWEEEIPDGWQRGEDPQIRDRGRRYRRKHHTHGRPTPGSEHELEYEILGPDPHTTTTTCLGGWLIDGVNAVPLAKDPDGRRVGNVEADMLLLTQTADGEHRQLLVEAKTISSNAWYAVAENLRQLRLFTASPAAQQIITGRHPDLTDTPAVTAVVLARADFYSHDGARQRAVRPALQLIDSLRARHGIDMRLATWDPTRRTISEITEAQI